MGPVFLHLHVLWRRIIQCTASTGLRDCTRGPDPERHRRVTDRGLDGQCYAIAVQKRVGDGRRHQSLQFVACWNQFFFCFGIYLPHGSAIMSKWCCLECEIVIENSQRALPALQVAGRVGRHVSADLPCVALYESCAVQSRIVVNPHRSFLS